MAATYDFKGKTILVTGAGAGIGKAICQRLVSSNAKVIAVSLLQDELDVLKQEMPCIQTVQVDLSDWKAARKAIEAVVPVYGLVNNAGIAIWKDFLDCTEQQWDMVFAINVKAVLNVSQVVIKSMIENKIKGSIVNISSVAAFRGARTGTMYCGSKSALQAMTKVMALEFAPLGIRVNTVNPTLVRTGMMEKFWTNEEFMKYSLPKIPLGRIAEPDEVAQAVQFLLSEESSMVHGSPLLVDGGSQALLSLLQKGKVTGTIYNSSKGALQAMTKVMALEYGPHGIRINTVNPTLVKTGLMESVWRNEELAKQFLTRIPFGRFVEVVEVANAVVFLLSDTSSMVDGSPLSVDGGTQA